MIDQDDQLEIKEETKKAENTHAPSRILLLDRI